MQDEDLFYLEEFEEIFKKEGMVDIDFPKLSTRELLNYLKNIKKFFLLNDVEDSMLCGTYIAKNNNGILRYEPNNNEKLETIKHFMDKVRFFLNDYIVVVNELLNRKLNHKYDLILKADIEDVKSYCLRNGFYDKGLHFAKIINKIY